jgi:hypothetical protein
VVIVDAGGGTIDISVYSRNLKTAKDAYEEIAAPQCTIGLFLLPSQLTDMRTLRSFPWFRLC